MFTLREQQQEYASVGLGLVVKVTTRFDPSRIRARLAYWLDEIVNQLASQARMDMESGGAEVIDDERGRIRARKTAIQAGMSNTTWVVGAPGGPRPPSATATYGKMAAQAAVGIALPWVGIAWAIGSFFGKKKKPKIPMPWDTLYSTALPYAKEQTNAEEIARILEEQQRVQKEYVAEVEKVSARGAQFKLPEGVTAITKGGALVIQPRGKPTVRKL